MRRARARVTAAVLLTSAGAASAVVGCAGEGEGVSGWASVPGRVVARAVQDSVFDEPTRVAGRRVRITRSRPLVTYAYAVGGRRYTGDRPDPGGAWWGDRPWAEAELRRAAAHGAAVTVHYDPA